MPRKVTFFECVRREAYCEDMINVGRTAPAVLFDKRVANAQEMLATEAREQRFPVHKILMTRKYAEMHKDDLLAAGLNAIEASPGGHLDVYLACPPILKYLLQPTLVEEIENLKSDLELEKKSWLDMHRALRRAEDRITSFHAQPLWRRVWIAITTSSNTTYTEILRQRIDELETQRNKLLEALKHLAHNARKSKANMGLALEVANAVINESMQWTSK